MGPSQFARSQAKGVCNACCIRIKAFPFVVLVSLCYASPCWSHGIVGDALSVTASCALLTNRGGHLQSSAWQVLMPLYETSTYQQQLKRKDPRSPVLGPFVVPKTGPEVGPKIMLLLGIFGKCFGRDSRSALGSALTCRQRVPV